MLSMERGKFAMTHEEEPEMREFAVTKITDRLDFGDGSISLDERLSSEDQPLTPETLQKVEAAITSDTILVPIDVDDDSQPLEDDGCGDGRAVNRIFEGSTEHKRSLNRAKVFGGGSTMGVAAAIGLGKTAGTHLGGVFSHTIERFKARRIAFGAHSSDHSSDPETGGCGAIDNAPLIVSNAVKFEDKIRGAISVIANSTHDGAQLNTIFANYNSYADEIAYDKSYSGRKVTEEILNNGKVVKELKGPHLETHVVINTVPGHTINQELIREVSGNTAQAFAVDEWRMKQIAEELYDSRVEQQKAYLGMLVYTLATAATLTKGDLPVFIVTKSPELVAA